LYVPSQLVWIKIRISRHSSRSGKDRQQSYLQLQDLGEN
jgi:hypothetical protein